MSEFTEEYRIAQLLSKKMTGELTPEEKQELQKWEQNSPSAKEIASQVLNPMNKRQINSSIALILTNHGKNSKNIFLEKRIKPDI